MEERIKTLKVTKENIITFATFTRTGYGVSDLKYSLKNKTKRKMVGLFKYEDTEIQEEELIYRDIHLAHLVHAKGGDIYDVRINLGPGGWNSDYDRWLVPVRDLGEGKFESVNKITLNLFVGSEKVTYRLYFTEEEEDMWQENLEQLSDLQNGSKDTIWIRYSV